MDTVMEHIFLLTVDVAYEVQSLDRLKNSDNDGDHIGTHLGMIL